VPADDALAAATACTARETDSPHGFDLDQLQTPMSVQIGAALRSWFDDRPGAV
jgi:hypothetical protein